jgi:hypothetical protein
MGIFPLKKVTMPVAVLGLSLAVMVTDDPYRTGLALVVRLTLVEVKRGDTFLGSGLASLAARGDVAEAALAVNALGLGNWSGRSLE